MGGGDKIEIFDKSELPGSLTSNITCIERGYHNKYALMCQKNWIDVRYIKRNYTMLQ